MRLRALSFGSWQRAWGFGISLTVLFAIGCSGTIMSSGDPDAALPGPDAANTDPDASLSGPDANTDGGRPLLPPGDVRPVIVDGEHSFADVARGVAVGEWVQYDTTAPEGYFVNRNGGHDLSWGATAVWDAESQCILHYGGGHLTLPALSIYCTTTNTWIRGPLPHWLDLEGDIWAYTNHGYDRNAFDPETRRLFFYRGLSLWTFDLASETWSAHELDRGNSYLRDFAAFVPGLGVVAGRGEPRTQLFRIDPNNGSTEIIADALFHSALHTFGVYSPVHQLLFYGGGDDQRAVYVLRADGTSTRVTDSPEVIRTVATGASGGWALVDPDGDDFLVLFAPTGELHRYDPIADEWTFESRSPFQPQFALTLASTLPEHGVLLFATKTGSTSARITLHRPR